MLWWGQTLFQSGRINRNLIWIDWEAISPVMTKNIFVFANSEYSITKQKKQGDLSFIIQR